MVVKLNKLVEILVLLLLVFNGACSSAKPLPPGPEGEELTPVAVDTVSSVEKDTGQAVLDVRVGAERMQVYLSDLRRRRVGLVVNHSSRIGERHLVDTLLSRGLLVQKIFAPEHGFRGKASDGEWVEDERDPATGLPVISLYGQNKEMTVAQIDDLDVLVFDIQDVGVRFYTYLSTLHYVMKACARAGKEFIVLDRPNPNGHYVDGPILEERHQSFVGLHPVPLVYGMTIGEYARMIQGENWLGEGLVCKLKVIPCSGYDHHTVYELPVKPSPNLPNMRSIYLYPSLALFEGTIVNAGRGTAKQFQVYGAPDFPRGNFTYTPVSQEGAKYPKHEGKVCRGYDLTHLSPETIRREKQLKLSYLLHFYHHYPQKEDFFLETNYFEKLAGTEILRKQIIEGWSEAEIRESWQADLEAFRGVREKYLLYP